MQARRGKLSDPSDLERLQKQNMRSEWLLKYLEDHIHDLLTMSSSYAHYGAILYERVGSITLKLDGTTMQEWRLGDMIATLRFNNCFDRLARSQRKAFFEDWKVKMRGMRIMAGLPVTDVMKNEGE